MHLKFRAALAAFATTAAVVAGAFLALTGTPATAAGGAGVQSLQWQGPFGTHASCLTVQNEFRRYYTITIPCKYFSSSGYYFEYDNGR